MQQKPEFTFSSKDLVRRARISMRQMQWWTEHGYLPCARNGSGHPLTFRAQDILQAAVMRELKVKGVTLAKMRASMFAFNAANRYLVTDGRRMVIWSNDEMHVIRVAKESKLPVVVVDVLALRRQAGLFDAEIAAA